MNSGAESRPSPAGHGVARGPEGLLKLQFGLCKMVGLRTDGGLGVRTDRSQRSRAMAAVRSLCRLRARQSRGAALGTLSSSWGRGGSPGPRREGKRLDPALPRSRMLSPSLRPREHHLRAGRVGQEEPSLLSRVHPGAFRLQSLIKKKNNPVSY